MAAPPAHVGGKAAVAGDGAVARIGGAFGSPLDQVGNIPRIGFMSDLTCRFWMLDMRWKALDRAMNLS